MKVANAYASSTVSRSSGDVQSSTGDVQNMSSSEKKGGKFLYYM